MLGEKEESQIFLVLPGGLTGFLLHLMWQWHHLGALGPWSLQICACSQRGWLFSATHTKPSGVPYETKPLQIPLTARTPQI